MKQAIFKSLAAGALVLLFIFTYNCNGTFYSKGIYAALEKEFPGFLQVVENYTTENYEQDHEGFTQVQVVALDALYNRSFKINETERALNEKINEVGSFKHGSEDEEAKILKDALVLVQDIKEKYHLKVRVYDNITHSMPMTGVVVMMTFIYELTYDFIGEKRSKITHGEGLAVYPSKRIEDKPKGIS